jgi:predicted DNA-binding protein (MmcQ/YjbR family)
MARTTPTVHATWKRLRDVALGLPEAVEEFPWGDRVVKVRKKIFVFLGEGTIPLAALRTQSELAIEWVKVSYCLVAPKRLGAIVWS